MKKGDIAVISYTAKEKATNKIFDSTNEKKAREAGIFNEKIRYEPINVIIGNNELMKSLEEEIIKMKEGEEKKIELKPEKAFGERKPELIKVMPLKEFTSRDIKPVPGLTVELNNLRGKIQSVSGGRVRVDFNHELAGKELQYEIKLEKVITEKKEKLEALKNKYFPGMKAELKNEGKEIEIKFSSIMPRHELKAAFAETIFSNFNDIKKIKFIEEVEKKEKETEKQ
jgi:FKBP-type peptidyl-prolyl cis-trans isomerase SlyD